MRINTVPVEAYRQASKQSSTKNEAAAKDDLSQAQKITLPGMNDADAGSIKAPQAPSLLSGVLSSEETTMLVKHFARLGDSQESSQMYGTDARVRAGAQTGIKLDVKG